jgi:hypothetical protein
MGAPTTGHASKERAPSSLSLWQSATGFVTQLDLKTAIDNGLLTLHGEYAAYTTLTTLQTLTEPPNSSHDLTVRTRPGSWTRD